MENEFPQIKDLGSGIYAITCPGYSPGPGRLPGWGYVQLYLILGGERSLLLDTGYGNFDLLTVVRNITSLPPVVVNSHLHPDHSGGNSQFDTVYIGEHEYGSSKGWIVPEHIRVYPFCPEVAAGGEYSFRFLKDGELIDLGGRKLSVHWIPGHTKGSIMLHDRQTNTLFTGDSILKRVFYNAGVPFSKYRAALVRAKELRADRLLTAHWPDPLPPEQIDRLIALLDDFDPQRSEAASWDRPDAPPLRMFAHGGDFSDEDFAAISFSMDALEEILR